MFGSRAWVRGEASALFRGRVEGASWRKIGATLFIPRGARLSGRRARRKYYIISHHISHHSTFAGL